jgi:hypothetical protein
MIDKLKLPKKRGLMKNIDIRKTYCNPIPLPNYPRGMATYGERTPYEFGKDSCSRRTTKPHFRETADPTVIYLNNKWYLYPSCGMAYVSEDFITWKHYPIEPHPGYAPTVVQHRDSFLLTAVNAPISQSESPLGPFKELGYPTNPDGTTFKWGDPMLFSNDDGRLYAYWGCGLSGILAAELDSKRPFQLLSEPEIVIRYNPNNLYERYGDFNEDANVNYNEGAWMFKHNGRYYLTYATPGTQWKTYCMAAYISDNPMGPFVPQKKNPFLRTTSGLIQGPGHGCIVRGPNNTIWAFYTCIMGINHIFERRIGVDAIGIDKDGDLFSLGASEAPQIAPGINPCPENGNNAGLAPVSINKPVMASSEKYGRESMYAVDNYMKTWWEPKEDDLTPTLSVWFESKFLISAVRVMWKEEGMDYDNGNLPGAFRYKIEVEVDGKWKTVINKTDNRSDMLIEYLTFDEIESDKARLIITGWPKGICPGVQVFTVFGVSRRKV